MVGWLFFVCLLLKIHSTFCMGSSPKIPFQRPLTAFALLPKLLTFLNLREHKHIREWIWTDFSNWLLMPSPQDWTSPRNVEGYLQHVYFLSKGVGALDSSYIVEVDTDCKALKTRIQKPTWSSNLKHNLIVQ